ncbi:MAG: 2,3-butanediol dehydrogenase [Christensenellales bacterium]|jgi:(R,R)-butanediol dehydrogenase/meso-butanediol dehydrogenase/diacetyl reductase
MRAARWHGRLDIRVEDVKEPVAEKGEVVIEVKCAGICGTDIHDYMSGPHSIPVDKPDPLTGVTAPVIMGHELSGVITEIGDEVTGWKIGDRVVIAPLQNCGKCYFCTRGLHHLCVIQAGLGLQTYWGGFAKYCKVKDYQLRKMPDNMTFAQGALIEPVNDAYYAIERGNMRPEDNVLISGGGPIAALILLCAKAAGAGKVFMTEKHARRINMMLDLGADEVFNVTSDDVLSEVRERTGGLGVDVAYECTGSESGINLCFDAIRKRGTFVMSGLSLGEVKVSPWSWALKDINMAGLWCCNNYDYDRVIAMVAEGRIDPTKLITKTISLEDVVTEGFEALARDKEKKEMKIHVIP